MKKLLLLVILAAAAVPGASISYLVQVDTSTVSGSTGVLFLGFNAGLPVPSADPATVSVSQYAPAATLVNATQTTSGNTSGVLPGTVTMNNTGFPNLYSQNVTFGGGFSFVVTITVNVSGTAIAGSTFSLALTDTGFNPTSLSSDSDGSLLLLDVNGSGGITATSFPRAAGGASAVTATLVPEPGTISMVAAGCVLLTMANGWRKPRLLNEHIWSGIAVRRILRHP